MTSWAEETFFENERFPRKIFKKLTDRTTDRNSELFPDSWSMAREIAPITCCGLAAYKAHVQQPERERERERESWVG